MPSPLLGDAGLVPMCQVQGEQGAVAPPQVHLMPDLPLGPQSFRLSGAHPEEADAPRDPPDLDQK